jgi:RNA polymerase sigma-70 factor (ECF subfamily)
LKACDIFAAMPHQSGTTLLERARTGSPEAVNLLYERVSARVLGYIRLRLGRELRSRLESRDILQATLLKSFENLREFRGNETGSLLAWLARIADNEILDAFDRVHRQKRDVARETPLDDAAPVPAITRSALSRIIIDERARQLEAALDTLSPDHRDVILMRKFAELSFAEIGRRTGRSADASRMLFARAMAALTVAVTTGQAQ